MNWGRALVVWVVIVIAEIIHGTLRQIFLVPVIGDMPARQIGVFSGSLIILVIAWLTARWIAATRFRDQLRVGAVWVVLMVIFEVGLGAVLGYTQERLLAEYNPAQGGLMGLGLLFLLFAPALGARLRNRGRGRAGINTTGRQDK